MNPGRPPGVPTQINKSTFGSTPNIQQINNKMEIKGKIITAYPMQEGNNTQTGSTWKKQEFVMETLETYPKKIHFSIWGDRLETTNISKDDLIEAKVNIESREYNERWYTSIRAWSIKKIGTAEPGQSSRGEVGSPSVQNTQQPPLPPNNQPPAAVDPKENTGDDLPF
ncbi:MAG: DUF3127 domain-containing protein [Bacteroidales bacterium]